MSIFYINTEKTIDGEEFFNKYDFAKFIEGNSDIPEQTIERLRKVVSTKGQTNE